jgi:uncharacterized protein
MSRMHRLIPVALSRGVTAVSCLIVVAQIGCTEVSSRADIDPAGHRADIEAWRHYRYDLLAREGWLALTGLYWLHEGRNAIGASADNDIQLRGHDLPDHVGVITMRDGQVEFDGAPGVPVFHDGTPVDHTTVTTAAQRDTTVLTIGSLSWHVIERGGRLAVRVLDNQAPTLLAFDSIPSFALSPNWRFAAKFDRYDPPRPIMIPNVLGTVNESPSPGAVVFHVDGKTYRLDVVGAPTDSMFWIQFGDETNGIETYGGGRYLWIDAPEERDVAIVDFNKAYNPPCVFTPYATCPLPPQQNRLALRIEAGELAYER